MVVIVYIVFFFNDTATTEIYTLSLHDALPIYGRVEARLAFPVDRPRPVGPLPREELVRQPTKGVVVEPARSEEHTSELSHANISYAVFCLKKKKKYQH